LSFHIVGMPSGTIGIALLITWLVGMPLSYAVCLLVGLPLHLWFRHMGWTSIWCYVAAGAAITLVPAFLVFWLDPGSLRLDRWLTGLLPLAMIAVSGPLAACSFWSIARPDKPVDQPIRQAT